MDRPPDDADTAMLVITWGWYLCAYRKHEHIGIHFWTIPVGGRHLFIVESKPGAGRSEKEFVCLELRNEEFEAAQKRLGQSGTDSTICLPFNGDMAKKVLDGIDFSSVDGMYLSEGMDQAVDRPNLDTLIQTLTNGDDVKRLSFKGRVSSTRSRIIRAGLEVLKNRFGGELEIEGKFLLSDKDVLQTVATSCCPLTGFEFIGLPSGDNGSNGARSREVEVTYEALELFLSALKVGPCDSMSSLWFENCLFDESITRLLDDLLKGKPSIQKVTIWGITRTDNETTLISLVKVLYTVQSLMIHNPRLFTAVVKFLSTDTVDQRPTTHVRSLEIPHFSRDPWDFQDDDEGQEVAAALCKCVEADFLLELVIPRDTPCKCLTDMLHLLKSNKNMESFRTWSTVPLDWEEKQEEELYALVMDVLRVNYGLKTLELPFSGFYKESVSIILGERTENNGDYNESVKAILAERAENNGDWEVMKDMDLVSPTSARIFLCGYPFAGKTTLKETIMKKLNDEYTSGNGSKERTRGIEVEPMIFNTFQLTLWDMAGHDAYHSFHDLLISSMSGNGSSSCFLLVCNPFNHKTKVRKHYDEIDEEISYWLQFIASNTRQSLLYFPHVIVVYTNADRFTPDGQDVFKEAMERRLKKLQEKFKSVRIQFNHDPIIIDAQDIGNAPIVLEALHKVVDTLLSNLPWQLKASQEMLDVLKKYKGENPCSPLLQWNDFVELSNKIPSLDASVGENKLEVVEKRIGIVAASLHEAGDVIFYKDLGFMVVDPHWFCHGIIGQIISCKEIDTLDRDSNVGTISTSSLKGVLRRSLKKEKVEGVETEDLIHLMMKLNLCFKVDGEKILIPASLQDEREEAGDGMRQLKWPSSSHNIKDLKYVGRRVGPKDSDQMQLTLGFFPQLQVSFQQKYGKYGYELEKHMIKFIWNGFEIILEYSGQIGYYIDILVRSPKDLSDIHKFVKDDIVKHIYGECAHPRRGCAGVVLQESILRPSCVEQLNLCKHRSKQAILVEDLKQYVIDLVRESDSSNFCGSSSKLFKWFYTWRKDGPLEADCTEVVDLFTEEEKENICLRLGVEYQSQSHIKALVKLPSRVDKESNLSQSDFDSQMLKVTQALKNLMDKMNEILQFQVDLQKYDYPSLVRFEKGKTRGILSKTWIYKNMGIARVTLHFLCESKDKLAHEVKGQKSCSLKIATREKEKMRIFMNWILRLATVAAKIGAHVVGGMGDMVPDLTQAMALAFDTAGLLDDVKSQFLNKWEVHVNDFSANKEAAEKWLGDVLKEKKMTPKDFGLFRVRYINSRENNGHIAWICEECKEKGKREEKLEELSS